MTLSNNQLFSLNFTFPNVPQYIHIFKNILDILNFTNGHICQKIGDCLCLLPYLQEVSSELYNAQQCDFCGPGVNILNSKSKGFEL